MDADPVPQPRASSDPTAAGDALGVLHDEVARRLRSGAVDLPLPPRVATEVLSLTRDQGADVARLVRLLHQDPALAGHVLRIANSPAYLPRTPIVSLQQAVTRLGLRMLSEIALIASVQSGVFRVPGHEAELARIWRHAVASAAFGREIARRLRSNVESAFLCGLLHTIGKPLVLQTSVAAARDGGGRARPEHVAALVEALHVEGGLLLAAKWSLPLAVRDAIAGYAGYDTANGCGREPVITALADALASHLLAATLDAPESRTHRAWADLNLYPEDADALLARADEVARLVETLVL
ncbi:MAG: HDOD domain-containing protein [Thermodesulfobacteriota bacterium]